MRRVPAIAVGVLLLISGNAEAQTGRPETPAVWGYLSGGTGYVTGSAASSAMPLSQLDVGLGVRVAQRVALVTNFVGAQPWQRPGYCDTNINRPDILGPRPSWAPTSQCVPAWFDGLAVAADALAGPALDPSAETVGVGVAAYRIVETSLGWRTSPALTANAGWTPIRAALSPTLRASAACFLIYRPSKVCMVTASMGLRIR